MAVRGGYLDERGVLWDTSSEEGVHQEGWLEKKSRWLQEWRRRYFILKGSKLFFANDELSLPHGMIDLSDCDCAFAKEDPSSASAKRPHTLELCLNLGDERFLVCAGSHEVKERWKKAITKAIVKSSLSIAED